MNRQEDLSKVFDRTWTANHNDVAKRGRERERKFMNRMFGRKDNTETSHTTLLTYKSKVHLIIVL